MAHAFRRAAVLVCFAAVLPAARAESAELRWQFKKDQVHKYQFKHREVRTVEIGDQKLETTTTTEYEWQWTVTDVDDQGVATLAHKFTGLRVESSGKDFEYRYDSAQAAQSQNDYGKKLNHFYDQLRFGEYRVRLRPDGHFAGVTGFDKLLGEINADAVVLDFHVWNLRDDTFAWFLRLVFGTLPPKEATVGAKWESVADGRLGALGQLHGKTEYVLAKPEEEGGRTLQVVKFTGSQTLDMDTRWLNNPLRGPLKMTKLTGTMRFDAKANAVRSGSTQAELSGDLLFGNENNPAKMKLKLQHTLELEAKP